MFEKIIKMFQEESNSTTISVGADYVIQGNAIPISRAIEIVQEVAKEYDEFDVIYKKVCEFEKEYANREDWENVNSCIRLQNLLQYFKKKLKSPYQKGE